MAFDKNVNSYSPEGRIYQIEYAMKAMNHGVTTIALTTHDSVIVTSEKKILSKLQVHSVSTKHNQIDDHIGISFSGITADASVIVDKCRRFMLNFLNRYNKKCSVTGLLKHLCHQSLQFSEDDPTKRIFSRPFGVSVIMAAFEDTPKLYLLDPSGSYRQYSAKSIGNAYQVVDAELVNSYDPNKSVDDSIKFSLNIIKDVMKDKINKENVEIMVVNERGVHFLESDVIQQYIMAI